MEQPQVKPPLDYGSSQAGPFFKDSKHTYFLGAGIVAQQVKMPPATSAPKLASSAVLPILLPASAPKKALEDCPSLLVPASPVETQKEVQVLGSGHTQLQLLQPFAE